MLYRIPRGELELVTDIGFAEIYPSHPFMRTYPACPPPVQLVIVSLKPVTEL
jgi:hypothetical protein